MPRAPVYSRISLLAAQGRPHNDEQRAGWTHRISQPFYLPAQACIYRCSIACWYIAPGYFTDWYIHKATPSGYPVGDPIAVSSSSPTGQRRFSPGFYHRFDFSGFPVLGPGYYALVVAYPGSSSTSAMGFPIQTDPKSYPHGSAHKSTDAGVSWSRLADTNLLFQVWGWWGNAPDFSQPRLGNWYITDYWHEWTRTGVIIVLHTRDECHLIMRWSPVPPKKDPVNTIVRGATMCRFMNMHLVSFADVYQQEPGDTTVHTFVIDDWPYCQHRYFFFYGTVTGALMPSATPYFGWHKPYQPEPCELYERFDWPEFVRDYPLPFIERFDGFDPDQHEIVLQFVERFTW